MARERKINLPQTDGTFQLAGIVKGTDKEKFFEEKTTKSHKQMRMVRFGVETNKDSTTYLDLNGMVRDDVSFYKKAEEKGGKGVSKKIKWADRFKFNEEGFRLLGLNLGLTRTMNDKGKEINDKKTLVEYDACEYIQKNLKDEQSVFVKGKIEYGSYENGEKVIRTKKFVPSQISLCKPVEFEGEDFKETADFQQRIVFMGIEKDESDPSDIKFIVSTKIINYESIEETDFIIRDKDLALKFKKALKPFNSIDVWGKINNKVETEQVSEEDCWGEENSMDKVNKSFIRELVITGADPKSIDKETYSEEKIDEAVRALREFGEGTSNSWGSSSGLDNIDNEDEPWA